MDVLRTADRALRNLRHLCEQASRGGNAVRERQAYKDAVAAELLLKECLQEGNHRRTLGKSDQVAEAIAVLVVPPFSGSSAMGLNRKSASFWVRLR